MYLIDQKTIDKTYNDAVDKIRCDTILGVVLGLAVLALGCVLGALQ